MTEVEKVFEDLNLKEIIDLSFSLIDTDSSGEISVDELVTAFETLFCITKNDQENELSEEIVGLIKIIFFIYDFNFSGQIDKTEFVLLFFDLCKFAIDSDIKNNVEIKRDLISFYNKYNTDTNSVGDLLE